MSVVDVATARSERAWAKQSGTAFADYTGSASTAVFNYYAYSARGEVKTAMMARNAPDTDINTSPASADQLKGRRFEYRYDHAGNRLTAGGLGTAADNAYGTNALNQYKTAETKTVRVLGNAATNGATGVIVSVNDAQVNSLDRNFAADVIPANDSGPARGTVTVSAAVGSGSSYAVKTLTRDYVVGPRSETLVYDADGNLVLDGLWVYVYNAENRLIKMTSTLSPGGSFTRRRLEFRYDYLGRRVEKQVFDLTVSTTVPTVVRRFVYDGWSLVAETSATGALVRTYTWGVGGELLQIANHNLNGSTTCYFPSTDGNANLASLTRDDGTLAAVYEYSPFGELLRMENIDPAVAGQPFRFSSNYTDDETGLVYYGHRYYSPRMGRFINRDPIEEAGGLNLYGFTGNDGVNRRDWLGLSGGMGEDGDDGSWWNPFPWNWPSFDFGIDDFGSESAAWTPPSVFKGPRSILVKEAAANGRRIANSGPRKMYADWERASNRGADLALGTISEMGSQLWSTAKGQFAIADHYFFEPLNQAVDAVGNGAGWVADKALPGSGSGVKNIVVVGSVLIGPGKTRAATGVRAAAAESGGARQTMATGKEWFDHFAGKYGAQNVEWTSGSGRTISWPSQLPRPAASEMLRVRPPLRSSTFTSELQSVAGPRPPSGIAHHTQPLGLNGADNGFLNGSWVFESPHQIGHGVLNPQVNSVPYGTWLIINH